MSRDQLEFLITQYLDGTLPSEERDALERRLVSDAEARELLEQYRALDLGLKSASQLPDMKWDQLAASISAGIRQDEQSATAVDETTEYAITQYIDGELDAEERQALEKRLDAEPGLRLLMSDYQSLDRIARTAMPVPEVRWDRLHEYLNETIEDEAQRARYSIAWVRTTTRLALAACVLIVMGLIVALIVNSGGSRPLPAPSFAIVDGPQAEKAAGAAVVQIDIRPADPATEMRFALSAVREVEPRLKIQVARLETPNWEDPL